MGLQRKPCMAPRKTQLIGWALGASWRLQTDYGATQASLSSSSLALWAWGASAMFGGYVNSSDEEAEEEQ